MKLTDLKQKGEAARQFEVAQNSGRAEADEQADSKRAEFQAGHQQEQIRGAIEELNRTKQKVENFKGQISELAGQAEKMRGEKESGKKNLAGIYLKLEEVLNNEDVQKALAAEGKEISSVEQLIATEDFSDDPGVVDALEAKRQLLGIESQLVELRKTEEQLHSQIQQELGVAEIPGESDAVRNEILRLLEGQLKQIEEDLKLLEPHTPEGKAKAETELAKLLESGPSGWGVGSKDQLVRHSLSYNPLSVREGALAYREILGEEKFLEIITGAYNKELDDNAESFKLSSGLDTWDKDFAKVKEYPKQIEEARNLIPGLKEKSEEVTKKLKEFFLSEAGKPVLVGMVKYEEEKRFREGAVGNAEQQKQNIKRMLERIEADVNSQPQNYAENYVRNFVYRLDVVANDFISDKSYSFRDNAPAVAIVAGLSQRIGAAGDNLNQKDYKSLPDMAVLQDGIRQAEAFYERFAEKIKDPEVLKRILNLTSASYDYTHSGAGDSSTGLRSSLEHSYNNNYWYRREGNGKHIEEFRKLLPQFDAKNIAVLKFENADFIKNPRQGWETEAPRDAKLRQLQETNKFVESLRGALADKVQLDLVRAEIRDFEHSPKFSEIKIHDKIKKQQELATKFLQELVALQADLEGNKQILLQTRDDRRGGAEVVIGDPEFDVLIDKRSELAKELGKNQDELASLQRDGRPSWLSGKQGVWDTKVSQLELRVKQLNGDGKNKGEIAKNQEKINKLNLEQSNLQTLAGILTQAAKEMPEEYAKLGFEKQITVEQVSKKINALATEVSDRQPSPDQREFAAEYGSLKEKEKKFDEKVKKAVSDTGVRI